MTNSELLNELVKTMVEKNGYAYTAGYLQSFLMQAIAMLPKSKQSTIHSDLLWHLNEQQQRSA